MDTTFNKTQSDPNAIGSPSDHILELIAEAKEYNPGFIDSIRKNDIIIHALEVKTTSLCTLRCRDCTHLIPYTGTPSHMPASALISDIKKILSAAKVYGLIFMGGEVMIYPGLTELLDLYTDLSCDHRVGFVRMTTNGTVMPPDGFFEAFKKIKNGYVVVSDYGSHSICKEKIAEKCRSCGIPVSLIPETLKWRSLGDWQRRNYTEQEVQALYQKCHGKLYLHLYKDHLYHCYRAPVMNEDGLIPYTPSDYLDIGSLSEDELKEKLPDYIDGISHMKSCYYCSGFHNDSPIIDRAVQL